MFSRILCSSMMLLSLLAASGCTKVLVIPGSAMGKKNLAVIEQRKPKKCSSCTQNTYAVISAINGEYVDTKEFDEVHFLPGKYLIEVSCGGVFHWDNDPRSMAIRVAVGLRLEGPFESSEKSRYQMDLKPGSEHWVALWDSGMLHIKNPGPNGQCLMMDK